MNIVKNAAFFEQITAQSAEAITVADEAGNYIYVNQAFSLMIGYSIDELLQMSVFDVKAKSQDTNSFSRTKSNKEGLPLQVFLRRKDGSEFFSEVLGKVIEVEGEKIILGIIRDITELLNHDDERLLLERQLLHSQKLESLGILAGGIAHDFNNLLMVIIGNADLALEFLGDDEVSTKRVKAIAKASRRAADLAKQMLDYTGKGHTDIDDVNITNLVMEISNLLEVGLSKKVTLKYDFEEDVSSFEGDDTQIRQVIMNLITNASESIGDNIGYIALSTGTMSCDRNYLDSTETVKNAVVSRPLKVGNYCYIQVKENGCGMDAETLSKISEPFFTRKFTGRGLGMSVVQGIVKNHHGAMKVDTKLGFGTTIRIVFPLADSVKQIETVGLEKSNSQVKKFFSGKALIADDETMVREVAQMILEHLGLTVLVAANGQEAVQLYREHQDSLDFVFLDLMMPVMDGAQAFREMQLISTDIPIILSSGYNHEDAPKLFRKKRPAGFLQKPYAIDSVRDILSNLTSS